MNKLITLFVALLCVPSIFAYDCKIQGVYYDVNVTYRTATVTYKEMNEPSYSGSVVIPTTITYNKDFYNPSTNPTSAFIPPIVEVSD